jgi:hypothetical protein
LAVSVPLDTARQEQSTPENKSESFLRNPFVLGLVGIAGAFLVSAFLVLVVVRPGGKTSVDNGPAAQTQTPTARSGLLARSITAAAIRNGPGLDYPTVSQMANNQDVEVIGRNADASWFSVFYPPGSQVSGWVPKAALGITGSPAVLPVTSSTPTPTAAPTSTASPEVTATPTETATPTATPTPAAAYHLSLTTVAGTCRMGQHLLVSVRNAGPAPLENAAIPLLVQSPQGNQIFFGTLTTTIQPGQAMNIDTTYVVQQSVTVILDPQQTLGDANSQDHRVDCVPAVATAPAPR